MIDPLSDFQITTLGPNVVTTVKLQSGRVIEIVKDEKAMVRVLLAYREAMAHIRGLGPPPPGFDWMNGFKTPQT